MKIENNTYKKTTFLTIKKSIKRLKKNINLPPLESMKLYVWKHPESTKLAELLEKHWYELRPTIVYLDHLVPFRTFMGEVLELF